jgi:hypothetical protein
MSKNSHRKKKRKFWDKPMPKDIIGKTKMTAVEVDDFNGYLLPYANTTVMDVNGFKCSFHMPKAVGRQFNEDGTEKVAGLPPGNPRPAFKVDEYPACPTGWMHGSGKAGSYFVPVLSEHGMWLDFNGNNSDTHHVAAVVSVQGINPLTGRKTDPIRLEQYKTKCPVHGIEFEQDRFCKTCKHKWPGQNYLSSNNGGPFWLDGFMTEDGVIRQWFFTEDEAKGVAAQIIKDQRVFAIGVAFYRSKEPKPKPVYNGGGFYSGMSTGPGIYSTKLINFCDCHTLTGQLDVIGLSYTCSNDSGLLNCIPTSSDTSLSLPAATNISVNSVGSCGPTGIQGPVGVQGVQGPSGLTGPAGSVTTGHRGRSAGNKSLKREAVEIEKSAKKIEIGAGAKIVQRIHDDPESLDFWCDEPSAFLYINYCDAETCKKILEAGKREEASEGFLEGLKIAN